MSSIIRIIRKKYKDVNMKTQRSISKILPVLFGFFVMGFCDIVGISSDYAASAFGWSATMAGLIPSVVFVWFFLLGVPVGVMMNRLGRKNTVLLSMLITVVGMALPLILYNSTMTLFAYALLGIGNAILQVSVNPLLQNVVADKKMLTSSLTAGQVVKAVSSFVGPFIVLAAVNCLGGGDEEKWYYCFPIMGAITLVSGLWLLFTPIEREPQQTNVSVWKTLSLLGDKTILPLFFGIFLVVGTDVSTNFLSSKVFITGRCGSTSILRMSHHRSLPRSVPNDENSRVSLFSYQYFRMSCFCHTIDLCKERCR